MTPRKHLPPPSKQGKKKTFFYSVSRLFFLFQETAFSEVKPFYFLGEDQLFLWRKPAFSRCHFLARHKGGGTKTKVLTRKKICEKCQKTRVSINYTLCKDWQFTYRRTVQPFRPPLVFRRRLKGIYFFWLAIFCSCNSALG